MPEVNTFNLTRSPKSRFLIRNIDRMPSPFYTAARMKFFTSRACLRTFLLPAILMTFHQNVIRGLIFYPETPVAQPYPSLLAGRAFVPVESGGGTSGFRGYLKTPAHPKKLVAIFHGNAGHAAHRVYMTGGFEDDAVIFLAEYPGYGDRPGSPSEKSLFSAAEDDLRWLRERFPELPLVLMGESLGTGVVSHLAANARPSALILVSPFDSLASAAKFHYSFLPVDWLLKDRFDSASALRNLTVPLLILHGDRDGIVPIDLGRSLYESYAGPKEMAVLEGFGHNDLPWEDARGTLWSRIRAFVGT